MENMYNVQPDLMFGIIVGILIGLLVLFAMVFLQLRKVRKRYTMMINGGSPENLEQLIISMQININELTTHNNQQNNEISRIKNELKKMKSHVGVSRYNAFAEGGSDLSFSIAILDEEQNGFVLTGIHGRDQTFIYAKPVDQGQSSYSLTPEELTVINQVIVKRDV